MAKINPVAWLRTVADHAEAHNLDNTITTVSGYAPVLQISRPWMSGEPKLPTFVRWVASVRAETAIRVHKVSENVHLTVEGQMDGGQAVSVVVVLQEAEWRRLPLAELDAERESTLSIDTLARLVAEHADAKPAAA